MIDLDTHIENLKQKKWEEEIKNTLNILEEERQKLQSSLDYIQKEIIQIKKEIEENNTLSRKIFDRTDYKRRKKYLESTLQVEEQECKKKEQELENIKQELEEYEKISNNIQSGLEQKPYEAIQMGKLCITDEVSKEKTNSILKYIENWEKEADKLVLVHCTNFFPKDKIIKTNYDGNKPERKIVEYEGIRKKCKSVSHRHTVHFSINNKVQSIAEGNWDQPKFIVIEPLQPHLEQMKHLNLTDSWSWQSVKLGEKPILLVREDVIKEIEEDELKQFQVVLYKGDATKCVDNILELLGYDKAIADAHAPHHAYSQEEKLEDILAQRDFIINYMKNNTFNNKDKITFSLNELKDLYEIFCHCNMDFESRNILEEENAKNISNKLGIPISFVYFITSFGLMATPENQFTLQSDEEIYELLCNNEKVDEKNIAAIYSKMNSQALEQPSVVEEDLRNDTIDNIFKFQNRNQATKFLKLLENFLVQKCGTNNFIKHFEYREDGLYATCILPIDVYEKMESLITDKEVSLNQKIQIYQKIAESHDKTSMALENLNQFINQVIMIEQQTLLDTTELSMTQGKISILFLMMVIASIVLCGIAVAKLIIS